MRKPKIDPALARVERRHVLDYASALTVDRSDPSSVLANAKALTDWMEVRDVADRKVRYYALSRAHANRSYARRPDNAPETLIAEAEVFYAFLKAA